MLRATHLDHSHEVLASLGDVLALERRHISVEGLTEAHLADVGRTDFDYLVVVETDDRGRWLRHEAFAPERLEAAITRLYERHAELLPEGPERDRATGAASALGIMLSNPDDLDRVATVLAPDFESVDHRHLSGWSLRGADKFLAHLRALHEVADEIAIGVDEVLAQGPSALLLRRLHSGTARLGGGAYERAFLVIFATDAQGRIARAEWFDADRDAEALARFDALTAGGAEPAAVPFANAASRTNLELFACLHARDWAGIEALAAPELVFDERRRMVRNTCGRDAWLEQFRILFDVPASRFTAKLLATRGERLSLHSTSFTGEVAGGGGPLAMEDLLSLHEVDGDGRIVGIVLFDPEDLAAAHAELDARFDAGEGAAHARTLAAWRRWEHAIAIRDWDAMERSPAFVFRDHRLLGWGTTMSDPESAAQVTKVLVDLAPDVQRRHDHVRLCEGGVLEHLTLVGTRDGGAFENVFLAVYEWDAQGRCQAIDNYDADKLDAARARLAELAAKTPHDPLAALGKPNLATAAWDRQGARPATHDRESWHRECCAPDMIYEDRQRFVQVSGDRELYLASLRERDAVGALPSRRLVGTAGDRIAVMHILWSGGPPDGRFESVFLSVGEVDASGRFTAILSFDPDDVRAAQREAWARWVALEPDVAPTVTLISAAADAFNAHDRDRVRAPLADNVVVEDHRHAGMGRIEGADAYADSIAVLWELASAARVEFGWFWPAITRHGGLTTIRRTGEVAGGGAFESDYLYLFLHAGGRITHVELFELEDLTRALARFEALGAARE